MADPGFDLHGQVALVTGAASGIGRATALALGAAGAAVAVNHLGRASEAQAVADAIRAAGGVAAVVEADVTRADQVAAMAAQVQATLGAPDLLVNNAGVIDERPFADTSEADWDRVLDTDLKSQFLTCRALLPGMAARGRGAVVNIASDLAMIGRAQFTAYCAAKAGVIGLTRALAREYAPHGVRVNAVAPGPVDTAMLSAEAMSEYWREKELDIPQHRFASPTEIADTVLFLLSDRSRFYCGQVLGPNGGSVMP